MGDEMFDRLRRFGDTVDQAAVSAGAPAGPLRDVSDPRARAAGDDDNLEPVVPITVRRDRHYRAVMAAAAAALIVVAGAVVTARITGSSDGGSAASTEGTGTESSIATTTTEPDQDSATTVLVVPPSSVLATTTSTSPTLTTSSTTTTPPHQPVCPTYRANATYPIRLCDKGPVVEVIQGHLGVNVDGYFGPGTVQAVRQFQRDHALEVDGLVGPETWRLLVPDAAGVDTDGDGIIDADEIA